MISTTAKTVALVAVLAGIFLYTEIPTKLGFYRYLAEYVTPSQIGTTPAHHYGKPWGYTFEELYNTDAHDLTGQTALVTGANSG